MTSKYFGIALSALALPALMLSVPAARAHDESHTVAGGKLKMSDPAGRPGKRKFTFKTKKQLSVYEVTEDLTSVPSNLIVRGAGQYDGSSGLIRLIPSRWKQLGKPDAPRGWKYKSDHRYAYSGGVSTIMIKKGSGGGSLLVKSKGEHWDYDILSAQDNVDISLRLGSERYCAEFAEFRKNEPGKVMAKNATTPAECSPVCGNGILELNESCDDGNDSNSDTCSTACEGCEANSTDYQSTFEAVQDIIFDSALYQCSNNVCHGSAQAGGLDLRASLSHDSLVSVASSIDPGTMRIFPGDQGLSMLYMKLAAKTSGTEGVPGSPMPSNAETVSEDHLAALKLWIRGGAPETGVVGGTSELLESCLPPSSPNKMPQPEAPAPGTGHQIAMPGYPLDSQSEFEGCVPSYYDVSSMVPDEYRIPCSRAPGTNDTSECYTYNSTRLAQDPQSHHSIIHYYDGAYGWDDPGWGQWRCYLGENAGQACDPTSRWTGGEDPCPGGVCGGETKSGVGCIAVGGFGPPDYGLRNNNAPSFGGAQEATNVSNRPDGVWSRLPLAAVVVWNSHAFNLTNDDMNMEGWLNFGYTDDRRFPARGIFASRYIFTQDVPPFESREYCATYTFDEGALLYDLSSHTHQWGVRWRYYLPPNEPCGDGPDAPNGTGTDPNCLPGDLDDIFYENYDYQDAFVLEPDPFMHFTGSEAERTIKYCSLFDNGEADPSTVKRQSTSPDVPDGAVLGFIPGGPCSDEEVACMGGPNKGQLCGGDDLNCPLSECDACPVRGGVTTGDEMFIATGGYYIPND
jgi:cysteine-rich repeat protein